MECGECQGKVSDKAAACPHCGAPVVAANEDLAQHGKQEVPQNDDDRSLAIAHSQPIQKKAVKQNKSADTSSDTTALTNCRVCKKEISKKITGSCPKCGARFPALSAGELRKQQQADKQNKSADTSKEDASKQGVQQTMQGVEPKKGTGQPVNLSKEQQAANLQRLKTANKKRPEKSLEDAVAEIGKIVFWTSVFVAACLLVPTCLKVVDLVDRVY